MTRNSYDAIVIGADGGHSQLADFVGAPEYHAVPPVTCWYWSYWSGVPDRGASVYVRPNNAVFCFPTNDGLFGIFVWRSGSATPSATRSF